MTALANRLEVTLDHRYYLFLKSVVSPVATRMASIRASPDQKSSTMNVISEMTEKTTTTTLLAPTTGDMGVVVEETTTTTTPLPSTTDHMSEMVEETTTPLLSATDDKSEMMEETMTTTPLSSGSILLTACGDDLPTEIATAVIALHEFCSDDILSTLWCVDSGSAPIFHSTISLSHSCSSLVS